jgi:hypothetical protein
LQELDKKKFVMIRLNVEIVQKLLPTCWVFSFDFGEDSVFGFWPFHSGGGLTKERKHFKIKKLSHNVLILRKHFHNM